MLATLLQVFTKIITSKDNNYEYLYFRIICILTNFSDDFLVFFLWGGYTKRGSLCTQTWAFIATNIIFTSRLFRFWHTGVGEFQIYWNTCNLHAQHQQQFVVSGSMIWKRTMAQWSRTFPVTVRCFKPYNLICQMFWFTMGFNAWKIINFGMN